MSEPLEPNVSFSSLVGEHWLDAVDESSQQVKLWDESFEQANVMRFRLDGVVYTAVEDPSDGYRSSLDRLYVSNNEIKNSFPPHKVICDINTKGEHQENETLEFTDAVTGKIVLRVGTDFTDDYYPSFVADWRPQNLAINEGKS